jgi:hypothetical protein
MPTQFSRLLRPPASGQADPLADKLKQRDPDAERELARRYNRKITDRSRSIPQPPDGGSYDTYAPRLLALLWTLADNADALRALGRRLHIPVPTPPHHAALSDVLLTHLWDLGRDGAALEQLWQRQGLLPVAIVGPDTPENVLGFLCWRQHPGAGDELLRRYALYDIQLCADDDKEYPRAEAQLLERFRLKSVPRPCQSLREFAALASAKLLHLVAVWDYLAFPTVEHMLVKATHNELRDLRRAARRRLSVSVDEVPEAADLVRIVPSGDLQDVLAGLSHEERVIRKAQNGFDLTAEELDWAARRNLTVDDAEPSDAEVAAEGERIAGWLAENRSPTGDHLSKIFPWYKPTQFGKTARLERLRLLIDETDRYLDPLSDDAPAEARVLRQVVRQGMDELLRRTLSGNRPQQKRRPRPGPVACFEEWDAASRRLLHLLGDRPLDRRRADLFARLRDTFSLFAELFPVLVKLAACRRLARVLPAAAGLAEWLEAGQQWLSSLHEKDRQRCQSFADALAALNTGGTGQLLLAWLRSTQQPGPVEARLLVADRAWWLSQGREELAEPAETLAEFARAGKWPAVAETAAAMLLRLGDAPRVCWSAGSELRACLERLRARRRTLPARLDACRRLLTHLRETGPAAPAQRLADWSSRVEGLEGDAEDDALFAEVEARAAAPAAAPALGLLALWLQPAAESTFSERALKDLTLLWSLTHDPWYTWPADVPAQVAGLIAAARAGDWPRLSDAATRLLRHGPDLSGVSRSAGEEFRAALQRLAHRRGRRSRTRRTTP